MQRNIIGRRCPVAAATLRAVSAYTQGGVAVLRQVPEFVYMETCTIGCRERGREKAREREERKREREKRERREMHA
jgi:hypothetical protein